MNKKRIFVIIMCAMMIVSSVSIWAASTEIGVGNEQASCSLTVASAYGTAKTTPLYSGNTCKTTIQLFATIGGADTYGEGTTSASARKSAGKTIGWAESTHRCGSGYATLYEEP